MTKLLERESQEDRIEFTDDTIRMLSDLLLGEGKAPRTSWIQILREGRWDHPKYGVIDIGEKTFGNLERNFHDDVRGIRIAVDVEHRPELGAIGWVKELENRENGEYALVEWNKKGADLVKNNEYKYVSAEFSPKYKDPETGREYKDVLVAVTLTNRPFIKRMEPVLLSESAMMNRFSAKDLLLSPIDEEAEEGGLDTGLELEDLMEIFKEGYQLEDSGEADEREEEEGDEEEEELKECMKTVVLKKKGKGGKKMGRTSEVELEDIGELDTGLSEEDFQEEDEDLEFEEEDDGVELEEEAEEEEELSEDEQEALSESEEEEEVEDPGEMEVRGMRRMSEEFVDRDARIALNEMSRKLNKQDEIIRQQSETIKLAAVEEEVMSFIEHPDGPKFAPKQADIVTTLFMELSDRHVNLLHKFIEGLPSFNTREKGFEDSDSGEKTDDVKLNERIAEIQNEAKKSGEPIKFKEAARIAYKEVFGSKKR